MSRHPPEFGDPDPRICVPAIAPRGGQPVPQSLIRLARRLSAFAVIVLVRSSERVLVLHIILADVLQVLDHTPAISSVFHSC